VYTERNLIALYVDIKHLKRLDSYISIVRKLAPIVSVSVVTLILLLCT